MKDIHVTMIGDQKELIIREGDALPLRDPNQIKLSGRIDSISSFLRARYPTRDGKGLQHVDPDMAVVIVNEDGMWLELQLDPENPFGVIIMSQLEFSTELKQFAVNTNKQWSRKELIQLIRFNKRFFDADKHEILLNAWQKLNYTVTANVKNESDNRGNKDQEFKKKIDAEHIPTEFILTIPVFKGQPNRTFLVEICFEATDASFVVWFESTELVDIIDKDKKDLFARELEPCEQFAIICK